MHNYVCVCVCVCTCTCIVILVCVCSLLGQWVQGLKLKRYTGGTPEHHPVPHGSRITPTQPPRQRVLSHAKTPRLRIVLALPVCRHIVLWVLLHLLLAEGPVVPVVGCHVGLCPVQHPLVLRNEQPAFEGGVDSGWGKILRDGRGGEKGSQSCCQVVTLMILTWCG